MILSYELTASVDEDILVAMIAGPRNLETVVAAAREIKGLCEEHGVKKTLVDVRQFDGHLKTFETFLLVTKHFRALNDLKILQQAAVLDHTVSENRHFFLETVAVNRGYNFSAFDNVNNAMEWFG